MCGISCILQLTNPTHQHTSQTHQNGTHGDAAVANVPNTNPKRDHLRKELHESLEQIRHRGPDATGDWISDDCRVGTLINPLSPQNLPSIPSAPRLTHPLATL